MSTNAVARWAWFHTYADVTIRVRGEEPEVQRFVSRTRMQEYGGRLDARPECLASLAMKRLAPAVASSILFVLLALAPSVGALDPGFTKCSRVQSAAGKAKVTVRGVACSTGKGVARGFFERISSVR